VLTIKRIFLVFLSYPLAIRHCRQKVRIYLFLLHIPPPPFMMTTSQSIQWSLKRTASRASTHTVQLSPRSKVTIHTLRLPNWTSDILTDVLGRKVVEHRRAWAQSSLANASGTDSCCGVVLATSGLCWFPRAGLIVRLGRQFGSWGQQRMGWVKRLADYLLAFCLQVMPFSSFA
jgi:hypothetical protein